MVICVEMKNKSSESRQMVISRSCENKIRKLYSFNIYTCEYHATKMSMRYADDTAKKSQHLHILSIKITTDFTSIQRSRLKITVVFRTFNSNDWFAVNMTLLIGSASLARSIRIRFHFRHRTGRIRSVSDHRAGRVWRSRHRSKTPNCLPGARDQVPALFRNAIERRGAQTAARRSRKVPTFDMLRRMANPLSPTLLN